MRPEYNMTSATFQADYQPLTDGLELAKSNDEKKPAVAANASSLFGPNTNTNPLPSSAFFGANRKPIPSGKIIEFPNSKLFEKERNRISKMSREWVLDEIELADSMISTDKLTRSFCCLWAILQQPMTCFNLFGSCCVAKPKIVDGITYAPSGHPTRNPHGYSDGCDPKSSYNYFSFEIETHLERKALLQKRLAELDQMDAAKMKL